MFLFFIGCLYFGVGAITVVPLLDKKLNLFVHSDKGVTLQTLQLDFQSPITEPLEITYLANKRLPLTWNKTLILTQQSPLWLSFSSISFSAQQVIFDDQLPEDTKEDFKCEKSPYICTITQNNTKVHFFGESQTTKKWYLEKKWTIRKDLRLPETTRLGSEVVVGLDLLNQWKIIFYEKEQELWCHWEENPHYRVGQPFLCLLITLQVAAYFYFSCHLTLATYEHFRYLLLS